jgi:hypothetical protein
MAYLFGAGTWNLENTFIENMGTGHIYFGELGNISGYITGTWTLPNGGCHYYVHPTTKDRTIIHNNKHQFESIFSFQIKLRYIVEIKFIFI